MIRRGSVESRASRHSQHTIIANGEQFALVCAHRQPYWPVDEKRRSGPARKVAEWPANPALGKEQKSCRREWPLNDQRWIALDIAGVGEVKVDAVGIERGGRESEQVNCAGRPHFVELLPIYRRGARFGCVPATRQVGHRLQFGEHMLSVLEDRSLRIDEYQMP